MISEDFRNDKITITRDEFASIIALHTVRIMRSANRKAKMFDISEDTITLLETFLLAFGADVMTTMFDEGIEDLEIEGEENDE